MDVRRWYYLPATCAKKKFKSKAHKVPHLAPVRDLSKHTILCLESGHLAKMLKRLITNNLCSLLPEFKASALSCIQTHSPLLVNMVSYARRVTRFLCAGEAPLNPPVGPGVLSSLEKCDHTAPKPRATCNVSHRNISGLDACMQCDVHLGRRSCLRCAR